MTIETARTWEADVEKLLDKMEAWLLVQPEWVTLMALPERNVRKRVAELVAKELLLMPKRGETGQPGRQMRRRIIEELKKSESEWFKGVR